MVVVHSHVVEVRYHEILLYRHGTTVVTDGAAHHLPPDIEVVDALEGQPSVTLVDKGVAAFGHRVHVWHEP